MNGHGVGRAPGYGLNGAGEFYCEAVEGAQNPGGLLLSNTYHFFLLQGNLPSLQPHRAEEVTKKGIRL